MPTLLHRRHLDRLIKLPRLLLPNLQQQALSPVQTAGRNLGLALRLQNPLIPFSILGEGAIELEAAAHAAGLGEAGDVVVQISRSDGDGVHAEAVVEVLEVDAFAACG